MFWKLCGYAYVTVAIMLIKMTDRRCICYLKTSFMLPVRRNLQIDMICTYRWLLFCQKIAAGYFSNLWDCWQNWASVFPNGLSLRGSKTINYVEVAFRILKHCVFDHVIAFTLTRLIDCIVIGYEAYMEKRLIDFSNCRYIKAWLSNMTHTYSMTFPLLM